MEQFLRPSQVKVSRWLFGGLLILTVALLLITIWEVTSTTSMGENDFVGYWSATYLFRNGQNPYDPSLMELIQNTKLKTSQDATIMAWNPPTLFVFLLPLAWLSFPQAKFVWLSINLIFVIVSSLMLANTFNAPKNTRLFPVLLVFALVFPPVVSGFYMGQVTFLVLLGLIAAVWLIKKDWWFGAGMALILTTIKPHLMILSMTYLLIFMVQKRKYKGLAGLFFSGLVCIT
ncbi:MAG TPA: glycosyltransferase family 87 protein, partial [Anaerolineales bacterium]